MSFELVICVVVYRVFTGACDSEGRHIHTSSTTLGDFETQRAVERARILDALAARENEELTKASKDELLARLAQLDG